MASLLAGNSSGNGWFSVAKKLPVFTIFVLLLTGAVVMACNKTNSIEHFIAYGQSNSTGSKAVPVISATSSPTHLMFDGGTRPHPYQLNSFVPLQEIYQTLTPINSTAEKGETPLTGAANMIDHSPMLLSVAGVGGLKISELNKGTPMFDTLRLHMVQGKIISESMDKDYRVNAVTWIQGESDIITLTESKASYKTKLVSLQRDIVELTKVETGITLPPSFLMSQMNWRIADYPDIALAQYEAARDNDNIIMVCPTYHLPYSPDMVHLSNVGAKLLGAYLGKAHQATQRMMGSWRPVMPIGISVAGVSVDIKFNVPEGALRFNTTDIPAFTDNGFKLVDSSGSQLPILSMSINGDTVSIVLGSPPPAGSKVRYALDYTNAGIQLTAGRGGNLTDTATSTIDVGGVQKTLTNFCVAFEEAI